MTKIFRRLCVTFTGLALIAAAAFFLFPGTAFAQTEQSVLDKVATNNLTQFMGQGYPLWLAIAALVLMGGAVVALIAFIIARMAPTKSEYDYKSERLKSAEESEREKKEESKAEVVASIPAFIQKQEEKVPEEEVPEQVPVDDVTVEEIAPVEDISPVEEEPSLPFVTPVVTVREKASEEEFPVEDVTPTPEPVAKEIVPAEEVAPVEEAAPVEEVLPVEEVAPIEEAAPVEEVLPVEEVVPAEVTAPVEEIAPVEEAVPTEKPDYKDETAATLAAAVLPAHTHTGEFYSALEENKKYDRSFKAKLIQAADVVKERYGAVYNMLMAYKGVKSRFSWDCETFKAGGRVVAKITIIGKTPVLFLALDPAEYEQTKYRVEDASKYSKYAATPSRFKINGERKVGYARDLIEKTMSDFTFVGESSELPVIEYQEDEALLEEGLIKRI